MVSLRKKRFTSRAHTKRKLHLYGYTDEPIDQYISQYIKQLKGTDTVDDLWQEDSDEECQIEDLFKYINCILDSTFEALSVTILSAFLDHIVGILRGGAVFDVQ